MKARFILLAVVSISLYLGSFVNLVSACNFGAHSNSADITSGYAHLPDPYGDDPPPPKDPP